MECSHALGAGNVYEFCRWNQKGEEMMEQEKMNSGYPEQENSGMAQTTGEQATEALAVDVQAQEREMKQAINMVGIMMVLATAIFVGISLLTGFFVGLLSRSTKLSGEVLQMIRFLPNYCISMPLIILLLSKLPGTKPEKHKLPVKSYLASVAMTFGIMIGCNLIGLIITGIIGSLIGSKVGNVTMELLDSSTPGISVIFISLCAPVFEELVFRKMLVTRVVKYGEGVAVLLSGLMFGLFHGNFNQFIYAFGLGAFLAYIFVKTGDVKITISLHVIVNFTTSVILSGLMDLADFGTMSQLSAAAQESGDMTEVMAFMETHLVPILLLYGCLFLEYALAIVGIILLIVLHKRMKLKQGEYAFSKGKKAAIMFGNIGVILYCVFWIVNIIFQLLGLG